MFTRGACRGGLLGQRWPASCPVAMPRGRGGGGSGLRQAPTLSAPLASPSYYERVGQLQQALRDRYGRGTGQGVSGATKSMGYRVRPISRQWLTWLGTRLRPPTSPRWGREYKFTTDAPCLIRRRETIISHGNQSQVTQPVDAAGSESGGSFLLPASLDQTL